MTVESGLATQIRNIEKRYGRSIEEWAVVIEHSGAAKPGQAIEFLKSEYGLDHAAARRVALASRDLTVAKETQKGGAPRDPVGQLYAGSKGPLRPIHDEVMSFVNGLGSVEVSPKKGYLSLRRSKQFAMIQPGARWVNVGLILPGHPVTQRLESARSFNALFTHRVRLHGLDEVDQELKDWLVHAYGAAG